MKIKVAICTTDIPYSERLTNYFQTHYYDKFAWNIFTEESYLLTYLSTNDTDIVLIGREMESIIDKLPGGNDGEKTWAYLVEDIDDEMPSDIHQIKKYSRADKIYRDLLEVYSHKTNIHYKNAALVNNKTEIYAFVSAAGGTGTSTIASAVAENYAKFENVLYINFETIGASHLVFSGNEEKGFDEVIFALKSRRKALALKIASSVSRDKNGVYFFKESRNVLDIMDLTQDDLKELLMVIQEMREYDKIILDVGNGLGEKEIASMIYAGRIVAVMEDSTISEEKLEKYMATLQVIEMQRKVDICTKMIVFYNKIFKQTQLPEQKCQVRVAGGFPKIENGTYDAVVERLAGMEIIHNMK